MMKEIDFILFRHGQTDWNVQKRLQGQIDIPLNEEGKRQASSLIPYFQKKSIDACYASTLSRAYETAELALPGRTIIQSKCLVEASFGKAEGINVDEAKRKFGNQIWDDFGRDDIWDLAFPGGETRREVVDRVMNFLVKLSEEKTSQTIALCTHGSVMRNLLHFLKPDLTQKVGNCSIFEIRFRQGKSSIKGPIDIS